MAYDTRHRTRVRLLTGRMDFVSNENREVAGSDDGIGNTARVGNAERDKAIALLGEHWRAGRLDPGEHELRVTRARAAAWLDAVSCLTGRQRRWETDYWRSVFALCCK